MGELEESKQFDFIIRIKCKCDVIYRIMEGRNHCDIASQLEKKYKICEGLKNNNIWSSHTPHASINCYETEKVNVEIVRFK